MTFIEYGSLISIQKLLSKPKSLVIRSMFSLKSRNYLIFYFWCLSWFGIHYQRCPKSVLSIDSILGIGYWPCIEIARYWLRYWVISQYLTQYLRFYFFSDIGIGFGIGSEANTWLNTPYSSQYLYKITW